VTFNSPVFVMTHGFSNHRSVGYGVGSSSVMWNEECRFMVKEGDRRQGAETPYPLVLTVHDYARYALLWAPSMGPLELFRRPVLPPEELIFRRLRLTHLRRLDSPLPQFHTVPPSPSPPQ
jgi:hypothetical protein